ncbi:MAG TPA: hypothetical protein VNS58_18830 [Puia sp.]|nr:hypothetical protein [Puia sp.]
MDKSTISSLLTFALGALSASIPKFLDFIFENKKHRLANQKTYFERKLDVLQAYVATCTQLSASNFNNTIAVEQIMNIDFFEERNPMVSVVIQNIEDAIKNSQLIVQQMASLSSAVSMFIDLKINEEEAYDLIKSIHVDMAQLGNYKLAVDDTIQKYGFTSEPTMDTNAGMEYFEKKHSYRTHVQGISENYNKVKINLNECVKKVRTEFSKYDA